MRQNQIITLASILTLVINLGFFVPTVVLSGPGGLECPSGQIPGPGGKCILENPAPNQLVNISDPKDLVIRIIGWFLYFAGGVAVIFLIIGGFQYVASRGNEEVLEKAKRTITAAIIGLVVIITAFAVVAILNTLLTTPPPT